MRSRASARLARSASSSGASSCVVQPKAKTSPAIWIELLADMVQTRSAGRPAADHTLRDERRYRRRTRLLEAGDEAAACMRSIAAGSFIRAASQPTSNFVKREVAGD
jgi:hypothetical protein